MSQEHLLPAPKPENFIPEWTEAPVHGGPDSRSGAHAVEIADKVFSAPLPPSIREGDMIPGYTAPPASRRNSANRLPKRLLATGAAIGALLVAS